MPVTWVTCRSRVTCQSFESHAGHVSHASHMSHMQVTCHMRVTCKSQWYLSHLRLRDSDTRPDTPVWMSAFAKRWLRRRVEETVLNRNSWLDWWIWSERGFTRCRHRAHCQWPLCTILKSLKHPHYQWSTPLVLSRPPHYTVETCVGSVGGQGGAEIQQLVKYPTRFLTSFTFALSLLV